MANSVASLVAAAWGGEGETKRIGIFTDTHIGYKPNETALRLEQSYRLFKAHKVDMIFNLGDICEWHNPAWYRKYVEIREKVYPEGLPPEIYVYATHDFMKAKIPGDVEHAKTYEAVRRLLKISHDRYHSFELCGFTFLVYPQDKNFARMEREINEACKAHPGRPLFVLDHVPPANTVRGSVNGGEHRTRRIFDGHPEIVALTGHVHGSLVHEGKIWQGGFSAVNFGTIKNPAYAGGGDWHVAVMELSPARAVIRRYEISQGKEIDPARPWTLDFPFDPAHAPYSMEARRKAALTPAFAAGASLDVRRLGKPLRAVSVTWPAASTPGIGHYLVAVEKKVGDVWEPRSVRQVESDYIRPEAKRNKSFTVQFVSGYFDAGETVRIAVTPVDFFGTEGAPLVREIEIGETESWRTLYSGIPAPATPGAFRAFRGGTWFKVPPAALDVPPGTPCRMTVDVALDLPDGVVASLRLRTDKSVIYAHQGYIYTPPGRSCRRYVVEFPRPAPAAEQFNLFLQRAAHGKIRFDGFRIEAREKGAGR